MRWERRGVVLATLLLAVACTGDSSGSAGADTATPSDGPTTQEGGATPGPEPPAVAGTGPDRAPPWRDRPVVELTYDLSRGTARVSGSERVVFTPDLRTCEVVFRLWANKPETVRFGNALTVDHVRVDGEAVRPSYEARGAPDGVQGSLVRVPLPACLSPGADVTVDLDFTLTLGTDSRERIGRDRDLAWLASAFPMLAWERDRGWAANPVVALQGEMTTGEQFRLERLDVVVPQRFAVLGTGRRLGRADGPRAGTAIESFTAAAVRDVAVTVGLLDVVDRDVDGVRLHVGGPRRGTALGLQEWADESERALRELTDYLGPFPYSDLWVSVIPDCPSGIEFPGAIQYADLPPGSPFLELLVSHETAHMWFYGLVGNNQGRHPWLDEAFASFAQAVVDGSPAPSGVTPPVDGQVGRPMQWWARPNVAPAYGPTVYGQGSRMLLEARRAVGAERFDRLLRRYVADNAHSVATPDAVRNAFASAPRVTTVLEDYGALR